MALFSLKNLRLDYCLIDVASSYIFNQWHSCHSATKLTIKHVFRNVQVRTSNQCEDIERGGKASNTSTSVVSYPVHTTEDTVKSRTPVRKLLRRIAIMSSTVAVLVAICALVYYYMGCMSLVQLILVALVAYIVAGKKYRWFVVALRTAPRDIV